METRTKRLLRAVYVTWLMAVGAKERLCEEIIYEYSDLYKICAGLSYR